MGDHSDIPHSGGELNYTEITSSVTVTATTGAGADTVITAGAVVFDGSTVCLIEFYAPAIRPRSDAAGTITLVLYDGATQLGNLGLFQSADAVNDNKPVQVSRRLTPSAASHTYSVRAFVGAGSGNVSAGNGASGAQMPAFIRITAA